MPYQKKKYTKRTYVNQSSVSQLNKKVRVLAKKVNKIPKPELKHIDTLQINGLKISYDVNSTTFPMVDIPQGTEELERVGDWITAKHLSIQGRITAGATSTGIAIVRCMLLQSKQRFVPNPISNNNDNSIFTLANTNDVIHAMLDWDNRQHYRLLRDFKIKVAPASTGYGINEKTFKISYTFKKFNNGIKFQNANDTTPNQNQVFLLFVSDQVDGGTVAPVVQYNSRLTFYDS